VGKKKTFKTFLRGLGVKQNSCTRVGARLVIKKLTSLGLKKTLTKFESIGQKISGHSTNVVADMGLLLKSFGLFMRSKTELAQFVIKPLKQKTLQ
jgi:hypothetical protein